MPAVPSFRTQLVRRSDFDNWNAVEQISRPFFFVCAVPSGFPCRLRCSQKGLAWLPATSIGPRSPVQNQCGASAFSTVLLQLTYHITVVPYTSPCSSCPFKTDQRFSCLHIFPLALLVDGSTVGMDETVYALQHCDSFSATDWDHRPRRAWHGVGLDRPRAPFPRERLHVGRR